ncbi:hypothetical protein B0T17DRAFT_507450 [Bombardia bombarda]|uniref:Rhodopsin domain-containing protein n=1 Tax=Bombardia bombarda TaxID=252184 RepID=A0AA40CAE6_9PEZI|nr:hypothetical protein B0T17DRAFT_507450 [Bombardia bombarda]
MAPSLSTNITVVCIVFSILAILAVVFRFNARLSQRSRLALDDYMIIAGVVFATGLGANTISAVYLGHLGQHVALSPQGIPEYGPWIYTFRDIEWAGQLIAIMAFACTKISIVLFYRRIFTGAYFSLVAGILLGVICAWTVSFFLATLLECVPVSQIFVPREQQTGLCYDPDPMYEGMVISNLIIDVAILAVPQPVVWRLHMSREKRMAVSAIFLLGAFVVAVSAVRVYFFFDIASNLDSSAAHSYDITYITAPAFYWTNIEACVAVICACLPTMRRYFIDGAPAARLLHSVGSLLSLRGSRSISSSKGSRKGSEDDHMGSTRLYNIGSTRLNPEIAGAGTESSISSLNRGTGIRGQDHAGGMPWHDVEKGKNGVAERERNGEILCLY